MDGAQIEMPKYESPKVVHALKIESIKFTGAGFARIVPENKDYGTFSTDFFFASKFKGTTTDLGYFVVYSDGYQTWKSNADFENTHKKIND